MFVDTTLTSVGDVQVANLKGMGKFSTAATVCCPSERPPSPLGYLLRSWIQGQLEARYVHKSPFQILKDLVMRFSFPKVLPGVPPK